MTVQEAIDLSDIGTAFRETETDSHKTTIIGYKDGSGYCIVSAGGKMDYFLSRPANIFEMTGNHDWKPSK